MKFGRTLTTLRGICFLFSLNLVIVSGVFAQAELNPNQVVGRIGFTNQNPEIVDFLTNADGDSALNLAWFYLQNNDLGLNHNAHAWNDNVSVSSFPFSLTVETADSGVDYDLRAYGYIRADNGEYGYYHFESQQTAPVYPEPAADTELDVMECAALIHVDFVDVDGNSVSVFETRNNALREVRYTQNGSTYTYTTSQSYTYSYTNVEMTRSSLLVRADGTTIDLQTDYSTGSDVTLDRISYRCEQKVTPECDEVVALTCVIPAGAGLLGDIKGTFDLQGVDEHLHHYIGGIKAWWGPFDNKREFRYSTAPASGAFHLPNMVPSDVVDYPRPYYVWAEAMFGTGYDAQYYRSAYTSSTSDKLTYVHAGQTTDLGDTFNMTPAVVKGEVLLAGPPPEESVNCLDSIYRDIDSDYDGDGIPNTYYMHYSTVGANGTWYKAPGAEYNTSGAGARVGFSGSLDETTGIFQGNYTLRLANLNNDSAYWQPERLYLAFRNDEYYDPELFQYSKFEVYPADLYTHRSLIHPGETYNRDQKYCVSKVTVTHKTLSGTFHRPQIRGTGRFSGTDFTKTHTEYETRIHWAFGTPYFTSDAAQNGQVVLCLPEGEYELEPRVSVNQGGTYTDVELRPIQVSVGCGQEMEVSTDLQIALTEVPDTTQNRKETIKGLTFSDGNVTSISYIQNDGEEVSLCIDCGENAGFTAEVELVVGDNTFEFIALDEFDNRSFVKATVTYDPAPVEIEGCNDIKTVIPATVDSTAVFFSVRGKKGCDASAEVSCSRDSGSAFGVGTTEVTCTASDSCETEDSCSFVVEVQQEDAEAEPTPTPTPTPDPGCSEFDTKPELTVSLQRNELWPPNHKFVPAGYQASATNTCKGEITEDTGEELAVDVTVWSDETEVPVAGDGSGNFAPDARGLEDGLQLRAERRGTGDGRVYLIIARSQNEDGNSGFDCSAVVVPHSKKAAARAAVHAQATKAVNHCKMTGQPYPGYTQHGVSEEIGKQSALSARALKRYGKKKRGRNGKKGKKKKGKKKSNKDKKRRG